MGKTEKEGRAMNNVIGSARFAAAFFILLCAAFSRFPLSAQTSRTDIKIFIPRPESRPRIYEQQDFFAEQFKMEISAANYTITDNRNEADYLVRLIIDNNEYYGQPGEKQYILTLVLVRTEDNKDIVQFAWPFTELTEMYQWNLYLVYQAMANVPMTKETGSPTKTIIERETNTITQTGGGDGAGGAGRDDRWRNKWMYLNFSVGADMAYMVRSGSVLTDQGMVAPMAFVGVEVQFLGWMSIELDAAKVRLLHDTKQYYITISPSASLKWVFKLADFAMLEPYAGAEYSIAVAGISVPWLSVAGGIQAGVRGGDRGAIIVDFNVAYSLLGSWRLASGEREYGAARFTFSAGYKLGFWDRKK
jgi:hypothetical protein